MADLDNLLNQQNMPRCKITAVIEDLLEGNPYHCSRFNYHANMIIVQIQLLLSSALNSSVQSWYRNRVISDIATLLLLFNYL